MGGNVQRSEEKSMEVDDRGSVGGIMCEEKFGLRQSELYSLNSIVFNSEVV